MSYMARDAYEREMRDYGLTYAQRALGKQDQLNESAINEAKKSDQKNGAKIGQVN